MKKIWLSVIFLIIAIAVIIGFLYILLGEKAVIDCGTDTDCMEKNFIKCNPSKTSLIINASDTPIEEIEPEFYDIEVNGEIMTFEIKQNIPKDITAHFLVKGIENKNCNFEVYFPELDKTVRCKAPKKDITIENLNQDAFLEKNLEYCEFEQ